MTPHEDEMLKEIESLHQRLAKSEKARIKWMLLTIISFGVIGFLLWIKFQ